MTTTTNRDHLKCLQAIIDRDPFSLEAEVSRTLRAQRHDDIASLLSDLMRGGCASGTIGGMVYYADTHAFFDRYYHEIEALREEVQDQLGEPLCIRGDLKNHLAWFAFEGTAFRLAREELGLEV
ncbi:MAG: hypothetical protein AAF529_11955 [Pseudomonadota bacterium]